MEELEHFVELGDVKKYDTELISPSIVEEELSTIENVQVGQSTKIAYGSANPSSENPTEKEKNKQYVKEEVKGQ
jgi:hypothetical protein